MHGSEPRAVARQHDWRSMNLVTDRGLSGLTRPASDLKIVPRINTGLVCRTQVVEDHQAHGRSPRSGRNQ
jgi:hypothetical protein